MVVHCTGTELLPSRELIHTASTSRTLARFPA
jgi:hypothetical protein